MADEEDSNYLIVCEHCGALGVADSAEALMDAAFEHTVSVHGTDVDLEITEPEE